MRYLPRALLAGCTGFAVSCLAACGGGAGLLSGNQAGALQNTLNKLSSAVSSHNCGQAASRAQDLQAAVQNLPTTVNVTLRQDLVNGTATASQLAARFCQQTTTTPTSTTPATTTSPPTTTATTPTTTATTPTTTATTPTTTTTPTTPTSPPPPPPTTPPATQPSGGVGPGGGGAGAGAGKHG